MRKLKFKYHRTIKKAEFMHADLAYHEEVVKAAKNGFRRHACSRLFHCSARSKSINATSSTSEKYVPGETRLSITYFFLDFDMGKFAFFLNYNLSVYTIFKAI